MFTFAVGTERNPLRQKKRYAPNLRDENLRNFQSKSCNKQECTTASAHLCVGLCLHFLITGFLRTFVSELAQAAPRFCCVDEDKTENEI